MSENIYSAIASYVAHGICALPASRERKTPLIRWHEYTQRMPTEKETERWRRQFPRADAVAVVCGAVSGNLECVDVDTPEAYDDVVALLKSIHSEKWLEQCYQERTPRGGMHIIYRTREAVQGNRVIARDEGGRTLIETRGEGGIVIVYPTPGYVPMSAVRLIEVAAKRN